MILPRATAREAVFTRSRSGLHERTPTDLLRLTNLLRHAMLRMVAPDRGCALQASVDAVNYAVLITESHTRHTDLSRPTPSACWYLSILRSNGSPSWIWGSACVSKSFVADFCMSTTLPSKSRLGRQCSCAYLRHPVRIRANATVGCQLARDDMELIGLFQGRIELHSKRDFVPPLCPPSSWSSTPVLLY